MKKIVYSTGLLLFSLSLFAQASYSPKKQLVVRANLDTVSKSKVITSINEKQSSGGLKKFGSDSHIENYYPKTDDNTFNKTILLNPDDRILVFHFINSKKLNVDMEIQMLRKVTDDKRFNSEIIIVDVNDEPELFKDLEIVTNPTSLFYYGKQFICKKSFLINDYEFTDTFESIIKN